VGACGNLENGRGKPIWVTSNHQVRGSSPCGVTNGSNGLDGFGGSADLVFHLSFTGR
jgi:hypothetical protein